MTTRRLTKLACRVGLSALAVIGLSGISACSGAGPTLDTIGETTATALRDAGTVQFTMTSGDEEFAGATVYEDGEVAALHVATTAPGADRQEWIVDDEYWLEQPPSGPRVSSEVDPAEFASAWDWAQVQEDFAEAATELEEVGSRDVDGTPTRGYELRSDERTETWWLDDEGRLLEYEFEFADGQSGGGKLFAYGEDLTISVP